MATQNVIESPDFNQIEKDAKRATRDAITLLWAVLNEEIKTRRQTVKDAKDTYAAKALNDAPTANQNNYDTGKATIFYFTGSTNFNLTGIRNGIEGKILLLHSTGSGTVTIVHASGSSDAANRFVTDTAGNLSLTTDQTAIAIYLNSRWRVNII